MQICDFIKDFAKINAKHILLVMLHLTLEIKSRNNRIDIQNRNKTQKNVEDPLFGGDNKIEVDTNYKVQKKFHFST